MQNRHWECAGPGPFGTGQGRGTQGPPASPVLPPPQEPVTALVADSTEHRGGAQSDPSGCRGDAVGAAPGW